MRTSLVTICGLITSFLPGRRSIWSILYVNRGALVRLAVIASVPLFCPLVVSIPASAQATTTQLIVASDPGDPIGGGRNNSFSENDGTWTVHAYDRTHDGPVDYITLGFSSSDNRNFWSLSFSTDRTGHNLVPGFYEHAEREPFAQPGHPGIEITANFGGCDGFIGNFTVIDAQFDYSGPEVRVVSFAIQFEQHCDGRAPALRGILYYHYTLALVPTILTRSPLPRMEVGHPLSIALSAVGGTVPYNWVLAAGQLPSGLSVAPDGQLNGTPRAAGDFSFAVGVIDSSGRKSEKDLTVAVAPQTTKPPVTALLMKGEAGDFVVGPRTYLYSEAEGSFSVLALSRRRVRISFQDKTGMHYGSIDFSSERLNRDLVAAFYDNAMRTPFEDPGSPGLDISWDSRGCNEVTGKFTVLDIKVDYSTQIPVVTSFAATFEQHCEGRAPALAGYIYYNYSEPLKPTVVSYTPLPEAAVSREYRQELVAAGGVAPYTWRVAQGQPPPGVSLNTSGRLSGIPTVNGDFAFAVQVTDSLGDMSLQTLLLPVIIPLTINSIPLTLATFGQFYSYTLSAVGGSPPYVWTVQGDTLPVGMSLSSGGAITGVPIVSSTYSFPVRVTDASNRTDDKILELLVQTPSGQIGIRQLTFSGDPNEYVSQGYNYYYGDKSIGWAAYAYDNTGEGLVDEVRIAFLGDGDFWSLDFSVAKIAREIVPGVYSNAQRAPFAEAGHPGIDITGQGRGCNTDTGSFRILDAKFDYSGLYPRVVSFAAQFEQHCEGGATALGGTVYYGTIPPQSTQGPVITKIKYKAGKKQLTVRGKNFDSTCSVIINGHRVEINPYNPKNEIGDSIVLSGLSVPSGTYQIQVANSRGELSQPYLFLF